MEKILTLHSDPNKSGKNIDKVQYDLISSAIVKSLENNKKLSHVELQNAVIQLVKEQFSGSIPWYCETVKLDLEARNIIQRVKTDNKTVYKLYL